MLAARANQENAIYAQQQAAAAKPLNQGGKGLAPKTPANKAPKTPFGKTRNDENATRAFGKPAAKVDRNAFITPANPRNRAPLGNKTTNAKALQTPAALLVSPKGKEAEPLSSTKPVRSQPKKSKIKIDEPVSRAAQFGLAEDPEERDVEYMPPRGVPLPERYDDFWQEEPAFPSLQPHEWAQGWYSTFGPYKDEDDDDLSDFDEKCRQAEERNRRDGKAEAAPSQKDMTARTVMSGPSHTAARAAASALRSTTKESAAPPRVKANAPQPSRATAVTRKPMFDRANPRFIAAKTASNSTIGYSKGRVVSSSQRPITTLAAERAGVRQGEPAKARPDLEQLFANLEIPEDDDLDFGFISADTGLDLLDSDDE